MRRNLNQDLILMTRRLADPDEEMHIPEVEVADDDEWFARLFPAFPEGPVPQRRARRRR